MAQQTAVEWFIMETCKNFKILPKDITIGFYGNIEKYKNMVEQAKIMEKKQIIKAWKNGENDNIYSPQQLQKQAEQYYNETYNNQ